MPSVLFCYRKYSDMFFLKRNIPVQICIDFCIKHGKYFIIVLIKYLLYKIPINLYFKTEMCSCYIAKQSYFFAIRFFYLQYFKFFMLLIFFVCIFTIQDSLNNICSTVLRTSKLLYPRRELFCKCGNIYFVFYKLYSFLYKY